MSENQKTMILIRGLSGSGKTTLAHQICEGRAEDSFEMHSADDYFYGEDGSYSFDPEELRDSHEDCQARVKDACADEVPLIVVHNTFTRAWECEPYFRAARRNGYTVRVVSLYDGGQSDNELEESCQHGVTAHSINKQRRRWELNVYPRGHRGKSEDAPRYNRRGFPVDRENAMRAFRR